MRLFRTTLFISFILFLSAAGATTLYSETEAVLGLAPRQWETDLSAYSQTCSNGVKDCQESSPALVDINADGYLDVVAATNKGYVVAVRHDGVVLWA